MLFGETVGQTVGFRVKGERKVSANTRLENCHGRGDDSDDPKRS